MINKKFLQDHDIQLFQETFKKITPLKQRHFKADSSKKIPSLQITSKTSTQTAFEFQPLPHINSHDDVDFIKPFFKSLIDEPAVKPEESLFFARPGLRRKQIHKLKKGQIALAASIDLHGMHADEALKALEAFFSKNIQFGYSQRCFCIIHGKGQGVPVLKNLVNRFLKQNIQVLAFCSAPTRMGGTGATLVLTKSNL